MSDSPSGLLKYPFIFRSPTGCVIITDKAMCYLPKESESLPKTSLRWQSASLLMGQVMRKEHKNMTLKFYETVDDGFKKKPKPHTAKS